MSHGQSSDHPPVTALTRSLLAVCDTRTLQNGVVVRAQAKLDQAMQCIATLRQEADDHVRACCGVPCTILHLMSARSKCVLMICSA